MESQPQEPAGIGSQPRRHEEREDERGKCHQAGESRTQTHTARAQGKGVQTDLQGESSLTNYYWTTMVTWLDAALVPALFAALVRT